MAFSVTTAISKAVCEHMFSFFLVEYPGIEFICYIVDACLTFWETAKELSEEVALFCIRGSNVLASQLLLILSKMWYAFLFISSIVIWTTMSLPILFCISNDKWCWGRLHELACPLCFCKSSVSLVLRSSTFQKRSYGSQKCNLSSHQSRLLRGYPVYGPCVSSCCGGATAAIACHCVAGFQYGYWTCNGCWGILSESWANMSPAKV